MEAAELAKMSQYDHFVVQLEVPDGIREGYRSFIAACDGAYYDGSDYKATKAMMFISRTSKNKHATAPEVTRVEERKYYD